MPIELIEGLVQKKIEIEFIKNFSSEENKRNPKIHSQILEMFDKLIKIQVEQKLINTVNQSVKNHIKTHNVDPTLISLIKSFIPEIKDLEIKKLTSSKTPDMKRKLAN